MFFNIWATAISVYTVYARAIKTCNLLNDLSDFKFKTIAIGTSISTSKRTLRDGPFNFVGKGECLSTMEYLIEFIKGNGEIKKVPGLYYFDDDGKFVKIYLVH